MDATIAASFHFVARTTRHRASVFAPNNFNGKLAGENFACPQQPCRTRSQSLSFISATLGHGMLGSTVFRTLRAVVINVGSFLHLARIFFSLTTHVPQCLCRPISVAARCNHFYQRQERRFRLLRLYFHFLFYLFQRLHHISFTLRNFIFIQHIIRFARFFLGDFRLLIRVMLALKFLRLLFGTITGTFLGLRRVSFQFRRYRRVFRAFIGIKRLRGKLFIDRFRQRVYDGNVHRAHQVISTVRQHRRF